MSAQSGPEKALPASVVTEGSTKSDGPALSAKELKAKKQAEKQARRAEKTADRPIGPAATESSPVAQSGAPPRASNTLSASGTTRSSTQVIKESANTQRARTASQSQGARPLALRKRASAENINANADAKKDKKEVSLFAHLYTHNKRRAYADVSKIVHPAVLALGCQMSSYVICGSNARCVAMLLAFKQAIKSYITPQGTSLSRHMPSHFLGPQIDFLETHRAKSVSMGNAIRWLKKEVGNMDVDMPEAEAKTLLCASIDAFIEERITAADTLIATTATSKIKNGSTIVTYAKSSVVQKTLLQAHRDGIDFKVIVLDSRPLFEGNNLARKLAQVGIPTQYMLITAAAHAIKSADLVLLGAHAMMANGRLCSRVGTASVAMLAHRADVPVIVCCESIKFASRVALDSIVMNELASPDELVLSDNEDITPAAEDEVNKPAKLGDWRDVPGLQLLNILHDVTPADYIDMVITEYGSLPPTSVPIVYSISTGGLE